MGYLLFGGFALAGTLILVGVFKAMVDQSRMPDEWSPYDVRTKKEAETVKRSWRKGRGV